MKSNTCGTCRFRGEPITVKDNMFNNIETRFFLCMRINSVSELSNTQAKVELAVVQDYSGYYSALCVAEDFGCNQWVEAELKP